MKLALLMFVLGVLTQAISFRPTKSIETTLQAILAILIGSAILSLVTVIKSKEKFDGLDFMSTTTFAFIVIYSLCFFTKLLPCITKQSLLLFNSVFLYYLSVNGSRLDFYILPSLLVLANAFTTFKISDRIKFLFYLWYLWMSVVLLTLLIATKPGQLTYTEMLTSPFMRMEWMLAFYSLGMICLYISVNVMHVLIPIVMLFRKFKDGSSYKKSKKDDMPSRILKSYFASIHGKYQEENQDPLNTFIILFSVIVIIIANHYVLHIHEGLLINAIFIIGIYKNRMSS